MEEQKVKYDSPDYHRLELGHEVKYYGQGGETDKYGIPRWKEKWYECSCGKKWDDYNL